MIKHWVLMILALVFVFVACDSPNGASMPGPGSFITDGDIEQPTAAILTVSVSPSRTTVAKGGTLQFTAIVTGAHTDKSVAWTVTGGGSGTTISTDGLLSVSPDETAGTLAVWAISIVDTAKGAMSTVTVSAETLSPTQPATQPPSQPATQPPASTPSPTPPMYPTSPTPPPTIGSIAVTAVALDKTTLALTIGESGTLIATVNPNNATNKGITWSTSNAGVATVSNGTVTAKNAGTANITVSSVDGGKTATCAVTVSAGSTPGTGQFGITFAQIADAAPEIKTDVIIYRTSTKTPTSWTFTLTSPEQYSSITWYINGTTVNGNSLTVHSMNYNYYSFGQHFLTLEVVVRDGRHYSKRVTFNLAD